MIEFGKSLRQAREAKGYTKCAEIRPNKIIPCNRCVELAGEALDFLK